MRDKKKSKPQASNRGGKGKKERTANLKTRAEGEGPGRGGGAVRIISHDTASHTVRSGRGNSRGRGRGSGSGSGSGSVTSSHSGRGGGRAGGRGERGGRGGRGIFSFVNHDSVFKGQHDMKLFLDLLGNHDVSGMPYQWWRSVLSGGGMPEPLLVVSYQGTPDGEPT